MRYILYLSFLLFSNILNGQNIISLKYFEVEHDFDGYLFYSEEKINGFKLLIVLDSSLQKEDFENWLLKSKFVKKVSISENKKDTLCFHVELKYHPDAKEFRNKLEETNLQIFWINHKRYWVESLITISEAREKSKEVNIEPLKNSPNNGNPETPEYYEFNYTLFMSKLKYMQERDYDVYFYQGYITQFQDKIKNLLMDRMDVLGY